MSRPSTWVVLAVVIVGAIAIVRGVWGAERGGWVITIGTPLSSETACNLDLASLANVVPSKTRLKCLRIQ